MNALRVGLALAITVFCGSVALAFEERTFDTPQDEALFDTLVAELRCLVCQNQNIADSDAELAVDLRLVSTRAVVVNRRFHSLALDNKREKRRWRSSTKLTR